MMRYCRAPPQLKIARIPMRRPCIESGNGDVTLATKKVEVEALSTKYPNVARSADLGLCGIEMWLARTDSVSPVLRASASSQPGP